MKAGSIPIGIVPDIIPEYLIETNEDGQMNFIQNSGVWTHDLYNIPQLIGETITKYLDDTIEEELFMKMKEISNKYNEESSKNEIELAYTSFVEERMEFFEKAIEEYKEATKDVEVK